MSPRAVYRTEFRRCDQEYALEPEHVPYPAAVQRVVERREPLAFAEPVPETRAMRGCEYWAGEIPYLRLDGPHPSMMALKQSTSWLDGHGLLVDGRRPDVCGSQKACQGGLSPYTLPLCAGWTQECEPPRTIRWEMGNAVLY